MSDETPRARNPGRGLGRGLSALFGDDETSVPQKPENLRSLPIEQLKPSRFQPRRNFDAENLEALTGSVREKGILQPILVRRDPSDPNRYEILAGERRWRAAQAAQLHEIPAIVRDMDDRGAASPKNRYERLRRSFEDRQGLAVPRPIDRGGPYDQQPLQCIGVSSTSSILPCPFARGIIR